MEKNNINNAVVDEALNDTAPITTVEPESTSPTPDPTLAIDDRPEPDLAPTGDDQSWFQKNILLIGLIVGVVLVALILFAFKSCGGDDKGTKKTTKIVDSTAVADSTARAKADSLVKAKELGYQNLIDSLNKMQPMNLLDVISQLDVQGKIWKSQVKAVQTVTGNLHQKALALDGQSRVGVWGQITQMSSTLPSVSTIPEILNTISADVVEIKKDIKEHRKGARASHNQAVAQRNEIQNQLDDLDTQITMARGALTTAKEELKKALQSGEQSKIDNQMINLQLRLEALERLQKIHK
ncbi:MAG: hypothetical protein WC575_01395 [Patescibacteria group bacterium]